MHGNEITNFTQLLPEAMSLQAKFLFKYPSSVQIRLNIVNAP